jgi:SAM-dependent methyltransferase
MHKSAYNNAQRFFDKYCASLPETSDVLDVGSYDLNGTMKPIFNKFKYTGCDVASGPNVDVVCNSNELIFEKDSFDIIISSSCFEHDALFWVTFLEMCRVLRSNGLIYICAPSTGYVHRFPFDCWRFYPDSWKGLEIWANRSGYNLTLLESYVDPLTNEDIWGDSVGIFKKK